MGRSRAQVAGLVASALAGSALLVTGSVSATPQLNASIEWQGECDDRPALRAEMAARGAELREVRPNESALHLAVSVERSSAQTLLAEVLLVAPGTRERRDVEARQCADLRRAVAWVLGVLAEEREAVERAHEPSAAEFPAPVAADPEPLDASLAPPPVRAPERREPLRAEPLPRRKRPCASDAPVSQIGVELVAGLALGPALAAAYRPCAWLVGFTLGASSLESLGYELDGRSVAIERTSAQAGAWLTLGSPALRIGLSAEAGRLRASGSGNAEGSGDSSSAAWFAVLAPARLSVPLLGRVLTAELGLAPAFTPRSFVLRYASGQELARPRHFELRGSFGLAGHF
jgi:hypothetical protein